MRERRTVKEIQETIQEVTETSGIFGNTFKKTTYFQWLLPYCEGVDYILCTEKGSLFLLPTYWIPLKPNAAQISFLAVAVRNEMLKHEYELKKLIATLDLDYNPIYNVEEDTMETYIGDGTSKNERKDSGEGDNTTKNERKENGEGGDKLKNTVKDILNTTYGTYQEKTNTTIGEETDTSNVTNTNEYGRTTGQWDTSNNVAPMDSDIFHSDTENVNNHHEDAHTDKLGQISSNTIGAREDSSVHTVNSREDINNKTIDNVSSTSYSNKIISNTDGTTTYSNKLTSNAEGVTTNSYIKHIVRKGNIGVTSAQELIKQEREIARFSIYQEIVNIFVFALCNGCYIDTDSCARDIYRNEGFYDDYIL